MAEYPLYVPRDMSRAKRGETRRRLLNDLAADLERHINASLADRPAGLHQFMYGFLAADMRVPEADVRDAMARVPGAGHNGITIRKDSTP